MSASGGLDRDFAHLLRLSDDVGTLEHARGPVPLRAHGYCVDDAARAVVVICREPSPSPALLGLLATVLTFLVHAGQPDGMLHNRLGYDRRWWDPPGTGDWWGRAVMAFGTAVARAPEAWMRDSALAAFERSACQRSAWPRAMAFAGIGAAELLASIPDHSACATTTSDDPQWTEGLRLAIGWFLGQNDGNVSMVWEETGGGADGLSRVGRSWNQGAESTLALLSTLQHARGLRDD